MDLRSVSVITRNIVASRTEADLLKVVCTLLVQSCNAEAVAIWLTHRNKGMTARPDHWFSSRIPPQQQSLLIDQNYLVGGLHGTGPYLKKVQALPPIDQTLQYIAAPLVFDGGIRGLLAAWALPDQAGALPDLIDLASQLTAVRLRALTDASRLSEQQLSIQSAQKELQSARKRMLGQELAAAAGHLALALGRRWQGPLTATRDALQQAQAALSDRQPLACAPLQQAQHELDRLAAEIQRLQPVAEGTVDLAAFTAELCLQGGMQLTWHGATPCPAAARHGTPAIFRAVLLELFARMQATQALQIHFHSSPQGAVWGLYAGDLTPALQAWAQQGEGENNAGSADDSAALHLARLLSTRLGGRLRITPRDYPATGAALHLPPAALE